MIHIRKLNLRQAREMWISLYNSNMFLTPYSSYEFAEFYKKGLRYSAVRRNAIISIYEFQKDNATFALVPLIKRGYEYYIYGDLCATGCLDFIYSDQITDSDFDHIFSFLSDLSKKEKAVIYLNKLKESSLLFQYLIRNNYESQSTNKCVAIHFGDSYDNYYKLLSKHVRQNIRTGFNRLNREGHEYYFDFVHDSIIPKVKQDQIMALYNIRMGEKIGGMEKNHFISTTRSAVIRFVRNLRNPITLSSFQMRNNVLATFYIDNSLAAFLGGYIRNNIVIVPRLAINSEYSVYSVGSLLVSEYIRYLIDNTSVRILDLSRGNEPYKYALGGDEYELFSFVLKCWE